MNTTSRKRLRIVWDAVSGVVISVLFIFVVWNAPAVLEARHAGYECVRQQSAGAERIDQP